MMTCMLSLLADIFENFRNKCIKIYEVVHAHFLSAPGLAWKTCKRIGIELELLTNIDKLLIVERDIRGGICHAINRYAKANNKYLKNYYKKIISSYLAYLDANNLYGWEMSQKLPVNDFEWVKELSKFNENFIKKYEENSNKRYILEVDIESPQNMFNLHKDLPFLPEKKKIKKYKKLLRNIHDIKALKQALNHRLILKQGHRVIQINQEAWLKLYIDMNTKLRTETKSGFKKVMH